MSLSRWPRLAWLLAAMAGISCLAALVAGYALLVAGRQSAVATEAAAQAGSLPRRVHALGRLEPAGRIRQVGPSSGSDFARVEKLLVTEGDNVEAGALLALLDHHPRRQAALAEAQAKLDEARARLAQIQAGSKQGDIEAQRQAVALLTAQQDYAARELARAKQLHGRQVLPVEELDQKQWAWEKLSIEKRRAEQTLASLEEVRPVDLEVGRQQVAAAQASLARAQAELEAAEVRAPVAGRVLKIHTWPGERLGNDGLLEMGDVAQMEAVAEVFEADLAGLALGQRAELTLDSSGQVLTGQISELGHLVARKAILSNDPVSDTDARVVEVRIRLDAAGDSQVARLSNARVEVTIELDAGSPPPESSDQPPGSLAGRPTRP